MDEVILTKFWRPLCLTARKLTEDETAVLAKGENFTVISDTVLVEGIKSGIQNFPQDIAEKSSIETSRILNKAKSSKSNLSVSDKQTIKRLNICNNILILPADKSNATIIKNIDEYYKKIGDLLDPKKYLKSKRILYGERS